MSGNLALDTNAVIAFQGGDPAAAAIIEEVREVFLPAPVLGELVFGALSSTRPEEIFNLILRLASHCVVLDVNHLVAIRYGSVRKTLREQGQPIPENDLWIAAICLEYDVPLLTHDRHFTFVPSLSVRDWTSSAAG